MCRLYIYGRTARYASGWSRACVFVWALGWNEWTWQTPLLREVRILLPGLVRQPACRGQGHTELPRLYPAYRRVLCLPSGAYGHADSQLLKQNINHQLTKNIKSYTLPLIATWDHSFSCVEPQALAACLIPRAATAERPLSNTPQH